MTKEKGFLSGLFKKAPSTKKSVINSLGANGVYEEIVSKSFRLVDNDGATRGEFYVTQEGMVTIGLADKAGRERVGMALSEDERPVVILIYNNVEDLITEQTRTLQEKEALIQDMEETQKTINETRAIIHDKRRSCTGSVPLSLFFDICKALQMNPDERFPTALKEAETKNNSAETKVLNCKAMVLPQILHLQKRIRRLNDMLQCADSRPGSLDAEVYGVLKKYSEQEIDITIDEAVGIALASIYRRSGDVSELRRIVTRGRFALREAGNCAADVVFDPGLRERMARKHRQLGQWSRHEVMKEYLNIAENSADHSTVKAYMIESSRLSDLPEHILYGLVVCGKHHAMRILDVEKEGLRVVEGNWNGDLNLGRFVPFREITWGGNNLIVYSRQPCHRSGLEQEFVAYDYTDPGAVGYESGREMLDDLNSFKYFKVESEELFAKLPLRIRDSLSILRFRQGMSYDITYYSDLVDSALALFPERPLADVFSAFVRTACCNPTGQIVVSTVTTGSGEHRRLSHFTREVPPDAAKQMYVFFNKEGGEEVSLYQLKQITEPVWREHGDMVPRIVLMTVAEFTELDETARRAAAILTPRRDHKGKHVDAESYFEEQLMRVPPGNNKALLMDDEEHQLVSFKDLLANPLQGVIALEAPFDMQGVGRRLSADDEAILKKYPVKGEKDSIKKHIARKAEIRHQCSVRSNLPARE